MTVSFPRFPEAHPVARPDAPGHRPGPYARWFKRALDLTLVVAAMPAVVPVVAVLAAVVAVDGGAPFYAQERIGRDGRVFRMWKLRSMVRDADLRLHGHLAADPVARAEWDRTQKLRHDPRVTATGRLLRRSSLDELPQLWNVLTGDMSLVGPRPMMPAQRGMYPGASYYRMRPGITGFWQTAGRHRTSFAARAEFDADYEAALSLQTDLRLLWRTLSVVARGTGC